MPALFNPQDVNVDKVLEAMRLGARVCVAIGATFEAEYMVQFPNQPAVVIERELAEALPWGRMHPVYVSTFRQEWELIPGE